MSEFLPDERATIELAGRLGAALPDSLAGWTVLLAGELGAGKATFARAPIRVLGHSGPVPGPPYTPRAEERPVGEKGRSRWWADYLKKNMTLSVECVLSGQHHRVDPFGRPVFVFDGDLTLGVGSQTFDDAVLADFGLTGDELVGQVNRQRHKALGLPAGKSEHHALIAGALLLVQAVARGHALRDI